MRPRKAGGSGSRSGGLLGRREFLLQGTTVAVGGLMLGRAHAAPQDPPKPTPPPPVETNLADYLEVPRGPLSLPGPFPGKVVQVVDPACLAGDKVDAKVVAAMLERGITRLTGKNMKESFGLLFKPEDVVGLKVNPVGAPLISTRLELTAAVIAWLRECGLPAKNIVIWDRFQESLDEAGYTAKNFPEVRIEALQVRPKDGKSWRDEKGRHLSEERFDLQAFYLAKGVVAVPDRQHATLDSYLNQHVFKDEHSYFGKLVTKTLTKIVNLPVFKNAGAGISMATKNLGYGAICNTGRLHARLFFQVCTEVLAAPWIRDKLVLNILDGIRGQYDGGPGMNPAFIYPHNSLYLATDPFALDMIGYTHLWKKQESLERRVNKNPRLTEYLRQAQSLGLGVADPAKIALERIEVERPEAGKA